MNAVSKNFFKNPPGFEVDYALLEQFELDIDPTSPESCRIPCKVLGYGEISTVFEIQARGMTGLAFKRMSIFQNWDELDGYLETYSKYNSLLEEIGIKLPPHGYAVIPDAAQNPIFYIIQQKVQVSALGNKLIHALSHQQVLVLVRHLLLHMQKLWQYNANQDNYELGIDGQISNWVLDDFDADSERLGSNLTFLYIDTSTPFLRIEGIEQMDTDLFLRSAPSFLAWILRLFFVDEVVGRYYDFRKVIVDLVANIYKEGKPELIPSLVQTANEFLTGEGANLGIKPINTDEIQAYYREDAFIWRLYLNMRRLDRFIYTKILRREYPFILPGKIER
jgi:hypothetical protein